MNRQGEISMCMKVGQISEDSWEPIVGLWGAQGILPNVSQQQSITCVMIFCDLSQQWATSLFWELPSCRLGLYWWSHGHTNNVPSAYEWMCSPERGEERKCQVLLLNFPIFIPLSCKQVIRPNGWKIIFLDSFCHKGVQPSKYQAATFQVIVWVEFLCMYVCASERVLKYREERSLRLLIEKLLRKNILIKNGKFSVLLINCYPCQFSTLGIQGA